MIDGGTNILMCYVKTNIFIVPISSNKYVKKKNKKLTPF